MRMQAAAVDADAETVALASTYLAPPSSASVAEASGENANIYVSDCADYSFGASCGLDDSISTNA